MNAQKGKKISSHNYVLEVGRDEFLLYQPFTHDAEKEFAVYKDGLSEPLNLTFSKEQLNTKNALTVDEETILFPMTLRKWKKGDHFYPTGMTGSKKVSKFFKDEKYTATQKAAQWLLCSGNDIVWIVGKRADRRFTPSENTINLLNINLK